MSPLKSNPSESLSAIVNVIVNKKEPLHVYCDECGECEKCSNCTCDDEGETPDPKFSDDEETQADRDRLVDYYGPGY